MSANINSISPDLRDYLLNLNLMPDSSILSEMHGIGHEAIINIGAVTDVQNLDDVSEGYREVRLSNNPYRDFDISTETTSTFSSPIGNIGNEGHLGVGYDEVNTDDNYLTTISNEFREVDILTNYYVPDNYETRDIGRLIPGTMSKQVNGYLDENQHINLGGPSTEAINVIGGFLQGDVGINPDGSLASGYDVRASIVGRGLSSTGIINDTLLGNIGASELARAMGNNAAFGLQQETIGRINTNPLDLLTGGEIFTPNYDITVPKSTLGKVGNFFSRVAGLELPVSLMASGSFEYAPKLFCKSYLQTNQFASNLQTNNNFISNTGKGQINTLFFNVNQNCYKPGYEDKRKGDDGINARYYASDKPDVIIDSNRFQGTIGAAYSDYYDSYRVCEKEDNNTDVHEFQWDVDLIEKVEKKVTNTIENPNFGNYDLAPEYRDKLFIDVTTTEIQEINHGLINPYKNNKESLLYKTKELFNAGIARTLITKSSDKDVKFSDSIYTPYSYLKNDMSKGSGVTCKVDGKETLCRVWSTMRRYNQVENLQKHSGFFSTTKKSTIIRDGLSDSVLGADDKGNGFPKIGPYYNPDKELGENIKNFMFSIENLAWADHSADLKEKYPCEVGPGDPITGDKGRIMWFPPYGINFTDNSSVNWETIPFIGRGEPIYTYNHTERLGTLQFQIIVDHPSVMNNMRNIASESEIYSTFAGCQDPDTGFNGEVTDDEKNKNELEDDTNTDEKVDNKDIDKKEYEFYFPNDSEIIQDKYEYSGGCPTTIPTYGIENGGDGVTETTHYNRTYFSLNEGYQDKLDDLILKLNEDINNELKITILGYASIGQPDGTPSDYNNNLSKARGEWILKKIKAGASNIKEKQIDLKPEGAFTHTLNPIVLPNDVENYETLGYKKNRKVLIRLEYEPKFNIDNNKNNIISPKEKVNNNKKPKSMHKYSECDYFLELQRTDRFIFDDIREQLKYFHPAFHSMTPEGLNSRLTFLKQCTRQGPTDSSGVGNLAFGRPPICILRIGDFYNTKIVIDNVNFSYEPLVWDLNPEGIGVQPMIVNVDMSFKFIGGSSLVGPINRLQNAVSHNFFANTQVYDERADRIKMNGSQGKLVPGTMIKPNKKEGDEISGQGGDEVKAGVNSTKKNKVVNQVLNLINDNKQEIVSDEPQKFSVIVDNAIDDNDEIIENEFIYSIERINGDKIESGTYLLQFRNILTKIIGTDLFDFNENYDVRINNIMIDKPTTLKLSDFSNGIVTIKQNNVVLQNVKVKTN